MDDKTTAISAIDITSNLVTQVLGSFEIASEDKEARSIVADKFAITIDVLKEVRKIVENSQ